MKAEIKTNRHWTPSDLSGALYLGPLEFQDSKGEWHSFEVMSTLVPSDRIVFGGYTNTGFIESGFIRRDPAESTADTMVEMLSDLETYYNAGPQFTTRIVVNERM